MPLLTRIPLAMLVLTVASLAATPAAALPELEDEAWAEAPPAPDPLEAVNRRLFDLNLQLYDGLLEPAFRFYTAEVPADVREALSNLAATARQPFSALASAAAGRWSSSGDHLRRFGVNVTFGLLGTLDVASEVGIPRPEDFTVGDVLCRYAVPAGPYLVLPFFGPANLRGAAGRAGDIALSVYALGDLHLPYIVGTNLERYERISAGRRALADAIDPYALARAAFVERDRACGASR